MSCIGGKIKNIILLRSGSKHMSNNKQMAKMLIPYLQSRTQLVKLSIYDCWVLKSTEQSNKKRVLIIYLIIITSI